MNGPPVRFAVAFTDQCERYYRLLEAPSAAWVMRYAVLHVRKIERTHRYKDPEDLLTAVEKFFQRYASISMPEWYEPGPWTSFIACSALDRDGALILCRNVIRAELEGIVPERWTA
jgi:hypothetical protein